MLSLSRNSNILLYVSVAFLVGLGLIMLGSTSPWAEPDSMRYSHLKRQSVFLVLGVFTLVVCRQLPIKFYERLTWIFFLIGIIGLVLCFVPGIKYEVNGSSRWISLPFLRRFQPSEPTKIAISLALAWWMAHKAREKPEAFFKGYCFPLAIVAAPSMLIFMQTDMGTTAVIVGSAFLALYIAGTRGWLLGVTSVLGVVGLLTYVNLTGGNRAERLTAFMNPEESKLDYGLQQWRSLMAFANGGITGTGLGNGAEKHGYLPFAHTDFIFPIIGEELGLPATLSVIFAFVIITVAGILISYKSQTRFEQVLAIGLTANIVIPGAMNIAVATSMLPNTGLPLPFVSYGGTNLLFTLASVGMLAGIGARGKVKVDPFINPKRKKKIMRL